MCGARGREKSGRELEQYAISSTRLQRAAHKSRSYRSIEAKQNGLRLFHLFFRDHETGGNGRTIYAAFKAEAT